MNETHLKVEKTARMYSLGEVNDNTTELIIVCHGYAMLAEHFLKNFEPILTENRIIIAPEGLSKFYWNGMGGKVRASWMTAEDREHEIEDYINYLDKVVESFIQNNPKIKITALGFSQGAATITRWVSNTHYKVDRLILWAGGFPKDCTEKYLSKYPTKTLEVIIGDKDEYISASDIDKEVKYLTENNINHSIILFEGKHNIDKKTLIPLF